MPAWLDQMISKVRNADSDADLAQIKDEFNSKLTADESGNHIHIHTGGGKGSSVDEDPSDLPPPDPDPDNDADLEMRIETLESQVAQLMDMLSDSEEEVELEEPATKDARRFVMRRGKKMKARDADPDNVPERRPEMIGETDLPGIEDLDVRVARAQDSINQEDLWQDTIAQASIIVPGVRVPTFDARLPATRTAVRLCSFRRQTMDKAFDQEGTRAIITNLVGIKTKDSISKMPCDTLKLAFNATANALKMQNNNSIVRSSVGDGKTKDNEQKGPPTIAEINARNKDFYSKNLNGARR